MHLLQESIVHCGLEPSMQDVQSFSPVCQLASLARDMRPTCMKRFRVVWLQTKIFKSLQLLGYGCSVLLAVCRGRTASRARVCSSTLQKATRNSFNLTF